MLNRVIAIDFDETICQTVRELCECINDQFGDNIDFIAFSDTHESTYCFHNPGFGTPCEVHRKLRHADPKGGGENAPLPLDGLQAALRNLHQRGYQMYIVTARHRVNRPKIEAWLSKQNITIGEDGMITDIHFMVKDDNRDPPVPSEIGSTESAIEREKELNQTLINKWAKEAQENTFGKAKIKDWNNDQAESISQTALDLGASILIDDRYEYLRPIQDDNVKNLRGILFGTYKWCYNDVDMRHPTHLLTHDERVAAGLEFPQKPIHLGNGVSRARNWDEVLELIKKWEGEEDKE